MGALILALTEKILRLFKRKTKFDPPFLERKFLISHNISFSFVIFSLQVSDCAFSLLVPDASSEAQRFQQQHTVGCFFF